MAGTNVTKLKGITIELPPLDLQHRFADFVRAADKSKFVVQEVVKTVSKSVIMIMNPLLTTINCKDAQ